MRYYISPSLMCMDMMQLSDQLNFFEQQSGQIAC
ncbi:Uncharacterised protein [Raoultella planticola]|nr:Uncharacterised protein [Raoultella planticola]